MHALPRNVAKRRTRTLRVLGVTALALGAFALQFPSPAGAASTGVTSQPTPTLDCGVGGVAVDFGGVLLWAGTALPGYPMLETPWMTVSVPAGTDTIRLGDYASWDWYTGREVTPSQPTEFWRIQVDLNNDGVVDAQTGITDDIPDGTAATPGFVVTGDFATTVAVPPGSTIRVRASHGEPIAGWSVHVSGVCILPSATPVTTTTAPVTTTTTTATTTTTTTTTAATTTTTTPAATTTTAPEATTTTTAPAVTTTSPAVTTTAPAVTTTTTAPAVTTTVPSAATTTVVVAATTTAPPLVIVVPPPTTPPTAPPTTPPTAPATQPPVTAAAVTTPAPTTSPANPETTLVANVAGVTVTVAPAPIADPAPSQVAELPYTGTRATSVSLLAMALLMGGAVMLLGARLLDPDRRRR